MKRVIVATLPVLGCASPTAPPYRPDVDLGIAGGFGALASVDLDADGRLDLVYTIRDNAVVLINQGAAGSAGPTFAAPLELPTRMPQCPGSLGSMCSYGGGLAIADFDGDGRPDIASTNGLAGEGSGTIVVFANTAGGFSAGVELTTLGYLEDTVAAGDLDDDGRPDLVSWGEGCSDGSCILLSVFLNTTSGPGAPLTFGPRVDVSPGAETFVGAPIRIVDLNRDGYGDIVAMLTDRGETEQSIGVLLGQPGGFAAPQIFDTTPTDTPNPGSITVGDFNADGIQDLAVAHDTTNSVSVMLNTTQAGSAAATFAVQAMSFGYARLSLVAQDVNGDGRVDLTGASYSPVHELADMVAVAINQTPPGSLTPEFMTEVDHPSGASNADITGQDWLTYGDFDGDGTLDVAIACAELALDLDIREKP